MSLLTLQDVAVRRGRREVVHDLSLVVERGETVAVLGPNGAGKSTLLEAVGGVLPVAGGTRTIDGRVASVLQTPGLARRSVRANVQLALAWWGVPRGQRRARAMEALEQLRAGHLSERPADSLSGGERRRVHVARGLALRPDLLLLDEPFAGLDPEARAALCEDTSSALREGAGGVLVVVHDRAEAWALADRLVVLMDGRTVAAGPPAELLAAPPSAEVARFLGYDGELRRGDQVLLTRLPHVVLDPAGDLDATVVRTLPQQDGIRVELRLADGVLRAWHHEPGLRAGDDVRVRLIGGVTFPGGEEASGER
ncbi:ABC transporter ATP-binding protein [Nocardioides anomalus]|uniref:ABC transporter ATP-binding protein n=1 Tax=Nocardioides anomalus TaxID=2712223 RepID=A0A6G6W914_9ACTN|nr:ATP-binding cassette domain-containing protein [Nocardioides anomalus]QIG41841.1 ABC transporter ATP-binding protein [Nocardioides anomalus]